MRTQSLYLVITIFCLQVILSKPQPIQNTTSELQLVSTKEQQSPDNIQTFQEQGSEKRKNNQNEPQQNIVDYPVVKQELDYPEEVTKLAEKLTNEELQIKCQELKILNQKTSIQNVPTLNPNTPGGINNHNSQIRPVYIPQRTTFKPKYFTTPKPHGFYITHGNVATQKATVSTAPRPIKYIHLEPLILQKTILSDGRIVYFWHRSLPGTVEIAGGTTEPNHNSAATNQGYITSNSNYGQYPSYTSPNIPSTYPYVYGNTPYGYPWQQNSFTSNSYVRPYLSNLNTYTSTEENLLEGRKQIETTTESATTSTTEHTSYGYGLGSLFPFYSYGHDSGSTTTESSSTTISATPGPGTENLKRGELLYAPQFKFMVPVPYDDIDSGSHLSRYPWIANQYAYYLKQQQQNALNVQVPYNPPFYMIKAVAVPNYVDKLGEENKS